MKKRMSYLSLKKLYVAEVKSEVSRFSALTPRLITTQALPEPVQRYFYHCGYADKQLMMNAKIIWRDVYLNRGFNKNWMKLDCMQFNLVYEPTRIVYMKAKLFGILPFEARDKCQDGHGNMLVKFLKIFTVADAKGREIDESALVTVLAETRFIPAYALQDYITWTALDSKTANATLSFNGREVNGTFYFNDGGEFIRFETMDRYYSTTGKEYEKIKWSASADNYREINGIKSPSAFKTTWHTKNGDFDYFKGSIAGIEFNVRDEK